MKNKKIGITAVALTRDKKNVDFLINKFPGKVLVNYKLARFTKDELIEFLKQCDFAIVGLDRIDNEVLAQCPKLNIISKYGVGLDNIDFKACEKNNVKVLFSKGVNKRSVSEEVIGCSISLLRNLYMSSNLLKSGEWKVNGGVQLTGKTVGIIGVGNIGKDLIDLLSPFKCKILVNDIIEQDDYYTSHNVEHVSKEEIFSNCDVITVHTPLDSSTFHMVGENEFKLMKSSSIFINTARGGIVDEQALYNALVNNQIFAAAIDTYEIEPPTNKDLLCLPNLMCMPHIGGNAIEAVSAMGRAAIENLLKEIE
jgi:phosphoglycerate dehydrogenase-like enzyme